MAPLLLIIHLLLPYFSQHDICYYIIVTCYYRVIITYYYSYNRVIITHH